MAGEHEHLIIIAVLGIILVISAISLFSSLSTQSQNFKFSTERCSLDINPYSLPHEGILNTTWEGNTLVVEGYVKTFCGGATITGDYSIEGDNLTLKYSVKAEGPVTECNCAHKVIYEISNIEKKDYLISIQKV